MTVSEPPVVPLPDEAARAEAGQQLARLDLPGAGFGTLADVLRWTAGVQGRSSPIPFSAPRVVVIAGDHAGGVAAGCAPEDSVRRAASELGGTGPLARLAARVGASLEVVDVALSGAALAPDVTTRIRDGAAPIEDADACTPDEVATALALGRSLADSLVDSGVDLLVLASVGAGTPAAAAATAAYLLGAEPAALLGTVAGPDGAVDDAAWMRRCAAVRDALARIRLRPRDVDTVLAALGGPDLAAATGLIVGAAARRTPVLLDGPAGLVGALLAREVAGAVVHWCLAPDTGRDPAAATVARRIGLDRLLDLGLDLGEGASALVSLGLLQSALDLVSSLPQTRPAAPAADVADPPPSSTGSGPR